MQQPQREPDEVTLDIRATEQNGLTEVWMLPSDDQLREALIDLEEINVLPKQLMTFDRETKRFAIHPFYTRPNADGTFSPKYNDFDAIWFDWLSPDSEVDEHTVTEVLEGREGFTVHLDYGLGIKKCYRVILNAVAELTDSREIYIGDDKDKARVGEFFIPLDKFNGIKREIDKIDRRAKTAENEIKLTTAYNLLATNVGAEARPFRLGRNEIRNLIQRYAADPHFIDPTIQKELVLKVAEAAGTFAKQNPEETKELVSDIQQTRLNESIQSFECMIEKKLNESRWQKFFENDPFLLSFAFGYPVKMINGQSFVGGRKISGGSDKIADFLYKNELSKNAALIEIKKPTTKLMIKYRNDGEYSASKDLSGGITQALEQRYRFLSEFNHHRRKNGWEGENAVEDCDIDSLLVVGRMPNDESEKRAFQLFRKNSHNVNVITFDEILGNLKQIANYLRQGTCSGE